ncbi:hypothetical protein BgiMline_009889, partial [Biomphalaria glabrata]
MFTSHYLVQSIRHPLTGTVYSPPTNWYSLFDSHSQVQSIRLSLSGTVYSIPII